jgi:hypothetical protein
VAERHDGGQRRVRAEQSAGRVAGDQPKEQEGDDDDANQHRDRQEDPPYDIA